MNENTETTATPRQRKNYPGDLRTPGTKDYGVILGNLINYRNQLGRERDEQKAGGLMLKVAEKIKELGFTKMSLSIKRKVGRRKLGKFQEITEKKKVETMDLATECWDLARQRHEDARDEKKRIERENRPPRTRRRLAKEEA